ncbi:MAG TPA: FUSC family protein [Hyphomicrobiaceae bacterium]|nr:FUSC family protein [Hyphomicrobiaceae bacterium]
MANTSGEGGRIRASASPQLDQRLWSALAAAGPPLLFGLRMWASVCLALYVAFWLQLDNADWAGATAFIVSQPQLGASMRKGWYRLIGTLIGAVMIVVVTALFIQDRVAFLGTLALWGAVCAFFATVLRNFASYSAALAGYTAIIIASDTLGSTGGANTDVFMLAVMRASEICLGIVSAGIVLAGTDFGGARQRLAALVAALGAEIAGRFTGMLAHADGELTQSRFVRRDLTRRVIALDPIIDQALGEASQLRYHSRTLQSMRHGLFTALSGWRTITTRLQQLPPDAARQEADIVRSRLPPVLRSAPETGVPARWTDDPVSLQSACEAATRALLMLPAGTPSLRLLGDQTAKLLTGIAQVLAGLALLVDAPGRSRRADRGFKLSVPDFLPALLNAVRAFLAIGATQLLWVVTAWPSGAVAVLFTSILVLLFSPRGETAYANAVAFTLGSAIGIVLTAIVKFAVLPGLETFAALATALGLYLIPVGFGLAYCSRPTTLAVLTAIGIGFVPLLQPANQMTYDTVQFYNTALALFTGSCVAALAFALLPPLSPALRTHRLLASALRDLRHCAVAPHVPQADDWERRMYGRLEALPDQTETSQLDQLLAAFCVGSEVIGLRRIALVLPLGPELDAALAGLASGSSFTTRDWLGRLDRRLADQTEAEAQASLALRARASILALSAALARQPSYFNSGATE